MGAWLAALSWFRIMFLDGSGWAELRFGKAQPRMSDWRCPPFSATVGAAPPSQWKSGMWPDAGPPFGILLMERTLHHRIIFLQPARFPRPQFSAAVPGVRPRARFLPLFHPGFSVAFFEGKAGGFLFHRRSPISSRAAGTGRHPRGLPILNAEGEGGHFAPRPVRPH